MTPLEILTLALQGIATCATRCGCCEMHKQIAVDALRRAGIEPYPPLVAKERT